MLEEEEQTCVGNGTNATWGHSLDYSLAELPVLVAGSVVFIFILPFVLFEFRIFPIGTTSAVLLGAFLMVLCQVVSQEEVYEVIGHRDNLTTIFLLLGMMLLAQFFEREQLLIKLLRRCLKPEHTFPNYIWRVSLLSFVLSAFFTNDACCAILTPLLLKFWEVQERPQSELQTILLAIATSANIGSVTTIFGNPQMALIAARTSTPLFQQSLLDLRTCLMYLGPPAVFAYFANLGFLLLHHRIKTRHIEKSKLTNEKSISDQEMAGLTAKENGDVSKGMSDSSQINGTLKVDRDDFLYEGLSTQKSEEKLNAPCQLETILEDEVLEIVNSSPPPSSRVSSIDDSNLEDDDECVQVIENDVHDRASGHSNLESNLIKSQHTTLQLDQLETHFETLEYKPSKLQGAINDSNGSLKDIHEKRRVSSTLSLSEKAGIYRSLSAFSAVDFLPTDVMAGLPHSASLGELFASSESVVFQTLLMIIVLVVIALFLASHKAVTFDLGLVPMAGAIMAITFDAIFNRQKALVIMKRVDWSILMMFFGIFVWMHGLNKTRVPRYIWGKMGLGDTNMSSPLSITILCVFVIVGSNIFSNVPLTLIVLEQLEPCKDQLALVIYLAWAATIAGNLTLFGSVANLIVAQQGIQTLKYRLTFWGYIKYGFISTIVITILGVLIIYGLLQI